MVEHKARDTPRLVAETRAAAEAAVAHVTRGRRSAALDDVRAVRLLLTAPTQWDGVESPRRSQPRGKSRTEQISQQRDSSQSSRKSLVNVRQPPHQPARRFSHSGSH